MAAKFIALFALVAVAQGQLFKPRPNAGFGGIREQIQLQIQDFAQVKNPVSQFAHAIHHMQEKLVANIPNRLQQFADKGKEWINQAKNTIQGAAHMAANAHSSISDALQCARDAQPALEELAKTAEELLKQDAEIIKEEIGEELKPTADDIEERTEVIIQIINTTLDTVKEKLAEGKLVQAYEALKEGRLAVDAQVKEIVEDVKDIKEELPEIELDIEELGQEFYDITSAGAEAIIASIKECIKNGGTSTDAPTDAPTQAPTDAPTQAPTDAPTQAPTDAPTQAPTVAPTEPTEAPTDAPAQ